MSQLQSPPFSIARSLLLAVQFFTRLPLPASWLRLVQRRIDSGVVEDMAPRLDGPLPT